MNVRTQRYSEIFMICLVAIYLSPVSASTKSPSPFYRPGLYLLSPQRALCPTNMTVYFSRNVLAPKCRRAIAQTRAYVHVHTRAETRIHACARMSTRTCAVHVQVNRTDRAYTRDERMRALDSHDVSQLRVHRTFAVRVYMCVYRASTKERDDAYVRARVSASPVC